MTTRTARRPSRRTGRAALTASVLVGLLVSAGTTWQTSAAAFRAQTDNATNNWSTGSVKLRDDDAGSAMFYVTGLRPGMTGARCITVTSEGTVPAAVKLYGSALAETNGLATQIDLVVTEGVGGNVSSCTGFAPVSGPPAYSGTVGAFPSTYSSGVGAWTPPGTATASRTYRFDYTLRSTAPDSTQTSSASMTFTWEAQSTPAA